MIVVAILLWILPWKGYALWTASQRSSKEWFVFLMLPINTFAALDIFYIFFIAKKKPEDLKASLKRTYHSAKHKVVKIVKK